MRAQGNGQDGTVLPLVLLDVDGVLNAVAPQSDPSVWTDWRHGRAVAAGRSWTIRWSPSVVAAVHDWREIAEVQWLTTWGHDANAGLRTLLDVPELAVAGTYDDAGDPGERDLLPGTLSAVTPAAPDALTGHWWKFDVVRRLLRDEPTRRFVWIDDDLAGQADVRGWMAAHADCLCLAPRPTTGLRPDDLAVVGHFLRSG